MCGAGPFVVYILHCSDGSYYAGSTNDLPRRIQMHHCGHGSVWTARRRPVERVYREDHDTLADALARERQIKRWTRAKKRALIHGDASALHRLSKRRPPSAL